MRARIRVVFASLLSFGLVAACIGPKPTDAACTDFGGICSSMPLTQCGETMPYACSGGKTCCNPLPQSDSGVSATGPSPTGTTTSTAPAATSSSPAKDAGGSVDATAPVDSASSAPDSTMMSQADTSPATTADSSPMTADTEVPDTNVADTNVADTHSMDSNAPDSRGQDAGGDASADCPGYADPNTTASCHACSASSPSCQLNGCFNGYWCDTSTSKCTDPLLLPCDAGF